MEVSPAKSLILSATIHGGSYFFIQPDSFYKNKQHNCCFPTHYATHPYFYYKAILL